MKPIAIEDLQNLHEYELGRGRVPAASHRSQEAAARRARPAHDTRVREPRDRPLPDPGDAPHRAHRPARQGRGGNRRLQRASSRARARWRRRSSSRSPRPRRSSRPWTASSGWTLPGGSSCGRDKELSGAVRRRAEPRGPHLRRPLRALRARRPAAGGPESGGRAALSVDHGEYEAETVPSRETVEELLEDLSGYEQAALSPAEFPPCRPHNRAFSPGRLPRRSGGELLRADVSARRDARRPAVPARNCEAAPPTKWPCPLRPHPRCAVALRHRRPPTSARARTASASRPRRRDAGGSIRSGPRASSFPCRRGPPPQHLARARPAPSSGSSRTGRSPPAPGARSPTGPRRSARSSTSAWRSRPSATADRLLETILLAPARLTAGGRGEPLPVEPGRRRARCCISSSRRTTPSASSSSSARCRSTTPRSPVSSPRTGLPLNLPDVSALAPDAPYRFDAGFDRSYGYRRVPCSRFR